MKEVLLLIMFAFTFPVLKGQTRNTQVQDFLTDFLGNTANRGHIFYTKELDSNEKEMIIGELLENDTLRNWSNANDKPEVIDSLILTIHEVLRILNQLNNQFDTNIWKEIVLPNSTAISNNTLTDIFRDSNKGWDYFYSNFGRCFYRFSIPIFFRGNLLCAFYYEKNCGFEESAGDFSIYHRKNGKWVKWFSVYEWVY